MRIPEKAMALLLVCGFLSVTACAQEKSERAPVALQENAGVPSTDQVKAPEAQESNVSLDFRDADIANVLKILSYKSGVNIVVGPEVTGVVTIQLNDVPWKQALEVVLETYGYAYEQKGNIITVTTVENLKKRRENAIVLAEQEPVETRTFTLNFGRASEIIASIEKMRSERGSINFDERTNTLIITDIVKRLDLMEGVIKKLDRTTPQVLIEAKILETGFNNAENLGIDWVTKVTLAAAERPTTWPFTATSSNKYARDSFPGTDTTLGSANKEFSYGTLNFTQVQAIFEMLKQKTDTNILSSPRIVTMDNQPAIINIGEERRFITAVTSNTQTGQTQSTTELRKVGINFSVTPHVNNAGFITLDVEPEVSLDTGRSDIVDGNPIPIIGIETVKTRVMIKSGDTLIIAGLVKDQLSDTKKKLPLLGDIPLVGLIFAKSEKSNTKTDLVLFITPHIITPEVVSASATP